MDFNNIAIGTDIEEIERFENKTPQNSAKFLNRIYTENELDYCFKKKFYAASLCVRFCAKEAIVKALSEFDIKDIRYKDIEILNKKNNAPIAKISKYPNIKIKISLSHSKKYAQASAIVYNQPTL